ncbi:MAG: 2-hydroxyacid dehydrogenase, partial [Paracoccaceae bacterium]
MASLLITRAMPGRVLKAARERFDVTHRDQPLPMSDAETIAALRSYDAILPTLAEPLNAKNFAATSDIRCRILANFGVGTNHIDVAAANRAGIIVTNTPGAVTDATADIAVMLMLMSARRASEAEALLRSGNWAGWEPTQFLGLHVSGKTVGIIGMGRIGRAVAQRCQRGFGMKVVFHNRSRVTDAGVDAAQLDSLHAVMAAADVVIVAVPGGVGTRHLIDAAALGAMQAHAVIVNISRGDVMDEAALVQALQSGVIAGAGLDVYENEPEVPEELRRLPNVSLLP